MNQVKLGIIKIVSLILFCSLGIAACDGGVSSTVTPTPLPTSSKYVYITNQYGNSYTECSVESYGIESASCVTITPEFPGALSFPSGIAFNGNYAYITNQGGGSNSYTQCRVGSDGIESASCVTITPEFPGALSSPSGIAFNGNYAYITNQGGGSNSYTQCSVGISGIESTRCVAITPQSPGALRAPAGIAFNGNYAYIINQSGTSDNYTQCSVESSGIESALCVTITPQLPGALNYPAGIAFNGNYAYITNRGGDSNRYTQCSVGISGIETRTCVNIIPKSPGELNGPTGIAFNESYAYIINSNSDSYTQCGVGISGIESTSCVTIKPESLGALYYPVGIAFN